MAAVLSESVLDQNGPKWSKMTILVKMTLFRTGFQHSRDQNGPFWPEEVHFGPFRSANRTLAIPENFQGDLEAIRLGAIPFHLSAQLEHTQHTTEARCGAAVREDRCWNYIV